MTTQKLLWRAPMSFELALAVERQDRDGGYDDISFEQQVAMAERAKEIVDQGAAVIKAIRNVMASDTIDCSKAADFVRYRADQEIRKLMEMEKGLDGTPVSSV